MVRILRLQEKNESRTALRRRRAVGFARANGRDGVFFSCIRSAARYCEEDFSARVGHSTADAVKTPFDGDAVERWSSRERRATTMGGEKEERMTKKVSLAAATAAHAEGGTALNAFDNALLAAGIGNINLIKVSSILPPEVPVVELPKIKPGALIPTAYAAMTSEVPGERVAAAVGYAVPDDPAKNGVIMEFHGHATRAEAERQIELMLEEAFRVRGEAIREMKVVATEHTVERIGCALAAITLLAEEDLL
jgi:arginine decarboxylase